MFDKDKSFRQTNPVEVELKLSGQQAFDSAVFLLIGGRISDLLNDHRGFIPVQGSDGKVMIVAKSQIVSITEKEVSSHQHREDRRRDEKKSDEKPNGTRHQESDESKSGFDQDMGKKQPFDPYKVLRVSPLASLEEIKDAYKKRIKAVHPDTIAAFELDEDLARAAVLSTQKVNHAYRMILKRRNI